MTHSLRLELPEEVYAPLVEAGKRMGAPPEQVAVEWLKTVTYHAVQDPVEQFIGAVRGNTPDWADQHDRYVGQAVIEERGGS